MEKMKSKSPVNIQAESNESNHVNTHENSLENSLRSDSGCAEPFTYEDCGEYYLQKEAIEHNGNLYCNECIIKN